MKFLRNVFLGLLLLYVLFWAGLAIYFSYVDRNKALFETQLSRYFDRPVTIGALKTSWQGLSPQISIEKFHVAGEGGLASPLAFDSLTTKLNPWSILRFWPQFTEFSVQQPLVEIASLSANQISIGGIKLSFDGSRGLVHPKTVVRWLLDQHQTQWSDGAINWRRQNGEHITYDDISFVFDRENQERSIVAGFSSDDGAVNFKAQSYGDLLSENHWGASLEILDGEGQAFVAQNDFSLLVNNGQGELKLKRLQVQTIQDFVALSGLTEKVSWSAQAKVLGYLHDMALEFSGPLFAVKDWKLVAQASEVGFDSKGNGPKVNNLNGQVSASKHGGEFLFSTQGSVFEWRDWFESPFNISSASGQFSWQAKQNGAYEISLRQGQFDDGVTTLSNLTVATSIKQNVRNINSIGDLFTVDSVFDIYPKVSR